VPSLFSRKPAASVTDATPETDVTTVTGPRVRGYTPSKKELGQATPKRKAGGRAVEPPPANRREALKRAREKQRLSRAETRAGMLAGKDEFLPARDKGPERATVRDIVDARRNIASYFLPVAFAVVIGSSAAMPPAIRLAANMLFFVLAAAVIVDSFLLSQRVKKVLTQRFPKSSRPPRSHYAYAIMRTISFRRMRMPAARVQLGDKI
jgi:Protein of unknown function (DUF3043)